MFEIGASLREARARRKLGYDQVEAETKIRAKYIRCMEDEQFDVLPSGTYVRGFLRTYADYLGLDGQLYVDEYSSRFGDAPEERISRRPRQPPRRNESSNAVLIALAGIVAVGVLLLAAWKLNPSSDRPATPIPPPVCSTQQKTVARGNPASHANQVAQERALARKKRRAVVTPKIKPVTLRVDISSTEKSWIVIRRLSNVKKIVYQSTLVGPGHIGGKVQKDPKGYLIASACNPSALVLTVNGKPFMLGAHGPWKVTADGVVSVPMPAGLPPSGC